MADGYISYLIILDSILQYHRMFDGMNSSLAL